MKKKLKARNEALAAIMPGTSPHRLALNPTGARKMSATVVLLTCSSRVNMTNAPLVSSDNPSASKDAAGAGMLVIWNWLLGLIFRNH